MATTIKAVPAAGYVRMSDDKQETSLKQQRQEIHRYAEKEGYQVVRWYTDEGISGDDTERRIQFKRMIGDASIGEFEAILCWDQDRFGRFDLLEAGKWISPLRDAGVHLATVTQGRIDCGPTWPAG
jgi:DNA invertase Pin-like site-specific DNA recombinase